MAKIVFWLGPAVEKWDPLTALETGIGGSETAAIHMSKELALLGHAVTVYADVGSACDIDADDEGIFPHSVDVEWLPYNKMPSGLPCDLFISSRQPEARRSLLPHCKRAWLWVHDLHCGPDWDNVLATDYDKILCLSAWAREQFLGYYPGVDPAKVVQTSNAVDGKRFSFLAASALPTERGKPIVNLRPGWQYSAWLMGQVPFRATYSSSPDRGLDKLLDLWPAISRMGALPGSPYPSELHVYYGFETWEKMATLQGRDSELVKLALLREKMERTSGVYYHGRAGQAEIAMSHLQSQLWLYPTDFLETSCITAMEAQAAGSTVIATRCGALPETVSSGVRYFIDGPTSREDYDETFLKCVREALGDSDGFGATLRSWAEVAKQWDLWLKESL